MQLEHFDTASIRQQAAAAGFATVELYIQSLLDRDADRLRIQNGVDAYKAGRHRPFSEFDAEFRADNNMPPRS